MTRIKHWAIFATGLSMNSTFVENLLKGKAPQQLFYFDGKRGALFSSFTLARFIKEEAIHDDNTLTKAAHRSLQTFSSGEQRKALLNYLIATKPDFLVLDNAFDMFDVQSKKNLVQRLTELSETISIIQIVKRKDSLLPFIQNAIQLENETIVFEGSIEEHKKQIENDSSFEIKGSLPESLGVSIMVDNPFVAFKNISVSYGEKKILNGINWTINKGNFWQLVGPNGSGKTTLLTMITGDNPKGYGQDLTLFGNKRGTGESIWDIKKKIGYVTPAMTTLFRGWNTVEKMVISGLVDSIGLYRQATAMQKRIAGQWIKLIGLEELKHARFSSLNEGQQCMVLIARSMIKHPPLLILDEPTHGLDDNNASILSALVNKIAEEGQTTIIFVSHRKEPGLQPKQVFELVPEESGSVGREL